MKQIVNLEKCINEINISKQITEIPYFFSHFLPIKNYKLLKLSEINENCIEGSMILQNDTYVLLERKGEKFPNFNDFFNDFNKTTEFIANLIYSYRYLLSGLVMLESSNIIIFDINSENICFNNKNQPLFNNFSDSFSKNNDLSKRFVKYTPQLYSLPLEVHLISFLKNECGEKGSISNANIEQICKDFIVKNQAISTFSQEFIKEYYKKCVSSILSLSITNKKREIIIRDLMEYSKTWDNYSISVLFLPIIQKLYKKTNKNLFLHGYSQLLLSNMDPNPKNRHSTAETLVKFQDLFFEGIDWMEIKKIDLCCDFQQNSSYNNV